MNIPELLSQLNTLEPDSILYLFPDSEDAAQALTDEFPFIKIVQELGRWVPPVTRIPISVALSQEFDVVCLPAGIPEKMLAAAVTCLKKKGLLLSDDEVITRNTGLKTGSELNGIYRYLMRSPTPQ